MTLTDPRLAYGSLPVLIWTAGADGACDYLNERWREFTGRPRGRAAGDGVGWTGCTRTTGSGVVAEYGGAVAASGPGPARVPHAASGRGVPLGSRNRGALLRCRRRSSSGYSGCTADVTDRRALEQRLAELGRTAEHRPARRRHRARLQQPAHRHPGPRRPAPGRELARARGAGGPGADPAAPPTAPPRSPASSSPSAAGRTSRPGPST